MTWHSYIADEGSVCAYNGVDDITCDMQTN